MEQFSKALNDKGIVILEEFIDNDTCDKIINDFYQFKNNSGNNSISNHRLYNLHLQSENVRNILFSDKILSYLDNYFKKKTALNSTIYFETGSQQCIHRDTPFFWSEPNEGEFVGVWFALEEANEENGKLEYYPYGHTFTIDGKLYGNEHKDKSPAELFSKIGDDMEELCRKNSMKKESPIIKKGSVVVWHADLPHGGSPILNTNKTRHSIVAHYFPENSYITNIDYYFGRGENKKIMDFTEAPNNRKMRDVELTLFVENGICNKGIK